MNLAVAKLPQWTAEADRGLGETLGVFRDDLAEQVRRGIAELWRFGADTYMVTRLDKVRELGLQLVVCCVKGRGAHQIAPFIIAAAKKQGVHSIRFHSSRPGMARLFGRYGFREAERVYLLDLTP